MLKVRLLPRKLWLFGAFFLFLALYLVFNSPYFRLEKIVISGNERVSTDQIRVTSGLVPGVNLLLVRPAEVAARLRTLPWVEEASVGLRLPSTVLLQVRERVPVAVVPLGEGQFLLVDKKGVAVEVEKAVGSFPVLTGETLRGYQLGQELTPAGYRWGARVIDGLKDLQGQISEVNVDSNLQITLYFKDGLPVFLGSADATLSDRLSTLLAILAETKGRRDRLQYIDLRFAGRPVVKER